MSKKKVEVIDREKAMEDEKNLQIYHQNLSKRFHEHMDSLKTQNIQINIGEAMEEYACIFGANKNLYRVIPSLQDGLRPGKRRMFYSWWELIGRPSNTNSETLKKLATKKKVASVISKTLEIHPHGESITETVVGEGQIFRNNVLTVAKQGNFGNMNGDPASANRYIEMGMTEYTVDCFFDEFKNYCIPMKDTYAGESKEPEYLPAKYPHILFNPQFSGIGYGQSSNIPPFNVQEVLEACIKLLNNPNAKVKLIPDFPMGCDIIDTGDFDTINKTGEGKITVQGSYTIDHTTNQITITSLPLNVFGRPWIRKIAQFMHKGEPMYGVIKDILNYTGENNVNIVLVLDKEADPEKVMDFIIHKSRSGFRASFPVALRVIDDYTVYQYGVKSLLLAWLDYRKDMIQYMYNYKLVQLYSDLHFNEAMLLMFEPGNAEETMDIAIHANTKDEIIKKLIKRYCVTTIQAEAVANMKIHNMTKDSYKKYKKIKKELKEEIKFVEEVINGDDALNKIIIQEMEDGIKKYGRPRQSKIIQPDDVVEKEVPLENFIITISQNGYVKKLKADDVKKHGLGSIGNRCRIYKSVGITSRESLFLVSGDGIASKIPTTSIPLSNIDDEGVPIARYFEGKGEVVGVSKYESIKKMNAALILVSKTGFAKRINLNDLIFKDGKAKRVMSLRDGDVITGATICDPEMDVILATKAGYALRMKAADIREVGLTAKGVSCITTDKGDEVNILCPIYPGFKKLCCITTAGKLKMIETRYFRRQNRGDELVPIITLDAQERLLGIISAKDEDQIQFFTNKEGQPDPVLVADIPVKPRLQKGVKMVKTTRGEQLVGYKLLV